MVPCSAEPQDLLLSPFFRGFQPRWEVEGEVSAKLGCQGTPEQVSLTAADPCVGRGHLQRCLKATPPREGEMRGSLASLTWQKACCCSKVQNKQRVTKHYFYRCSDTLIHRQKLLRKGGWQGHVYSERGVA